MTREEWLAFCKKDALETLVNEEIPEEDRLKYAISAFISDMTKHPETANHPDLLVFILIRKTITADRLPKLLGFFK